MPRNSRATNLQMWKDLFIHNSCAMCAWAPPLPLLTYFFLSPRVIQGGKDDQDKEEMEPVAPPSHGSKTSNKNEGKVARFAVECLEGLASV